MKYSRLLDQYPIISDQINRAALGVVLRELESVLERGIGGDIAEFGCYIGTTSVFIQRMLDATRSDKLFYAYDSFAGLPDKTSPDASMAGVDFKLGELKVSKPDFLRTFRRARLRPPITYKAWFRELSAAQLPAELAFAFLDGDFYESIRDSLLLAWPRLRPGGVITIDDYQREALPGVTMAVGDFFGQTPANLHYEHNIAIIKK